ncbi:MAG: type II secretion system protein N [Pseudomonadota bacterium]
MTGLLTSNALAELCRWLLVVGIAWTLATGVLSFLASPNTDVAAPQAASKREPERLQRVNLPAILNRNLFGKATEQVAAAVQTEKVAKTKLPLELMGVFVAEVPEDSAAIIAQKGKAGKLFTIRNRNTETIPGNAKLVEVYNDRVILERLGQREELRFDDQDAGFVANADPDQGRPDVRPLREVRRQRRSGGVGSAGNPESELGDVPSGNSVSGRPPRTPREFLEAYSDRLAKDPEGLLAELGVQPVNAAGGGGYRLGNLANSPQLSQYGLQSGDVILSVNGQPIGNARQDSSRLGGLLAQGAARLEVQRGSRRFYVTASLK